MIEQMASIEREALILVRNVGSMIVHRDERGLDRSAYTILSCLTCGGSMSIGELSEAIGLEASTLSRQTAAMRAAGLIERIPDPDGGMARKLRITSDGQARLAEACQSNMTRLIRATADWPADDLDAFAAYLERFNRGIELLDSRSWPRPEYGAPAVGGGQRAAAVVSATRDAP